MCFSSLFKTFNVATELDGYVCFKALLVLMFIEKIFSVSQFLCSFTLWWHPAQIICLARKRNIWENLLTPRLLFTGQLFESRKELNRSSSFCCRISFRSPHFLVILCWMFTFKSLVTFNDNVDFSDNISETSAIWRAQSWQGHLHGWLRWPGWCLVQAVPHSNRWCRRRHSSTHGKACLNFNEFRSGFNCFPQVFCW